MRGRLSDTWKTLSMAVHGSFYGEKMGKKVKKKGLPVTSGPIGFIA